MTQAVNVVHHASFTDNKMMVELATGFDYNSDTAIDFAINELQLENEVNDTNYTITVDRKTVRVRR